MAAAYLQALHAAEEDEPVVAAASTSAPVSAPRGTRQPDLDSESAFPSLGSGSSGKGKRAANGLSASSSPLWASQASKSPESRPDTPASAASQQSTPRGHRETLHLDTDSIQLSPPSKPTRRGEEQQPATLGDAAALVMRLNPTVRVDASTSKSTSTFLFAGPTLEAVQKAKSDLLARIAKKVTVTYDVPTSVKGYIIGAKGGELVLWLMDAFETGHAGRTLKQIMEQSGTQIQLPPKEDGAATPTLYDSEQAQDDSTIPITIYGPPEGCELAKTRLEAIVAERAAKIVHTAKLIPPEFDAAMWPFIKRDLSPKWSDPGVQVDLIKDGIVEVKGEKEKVAQWAAEIKALHDTLKKTTKTTSLVIPKRQHRFLRGANAEEILQKTGWAVELPPANSNNEQVGLRGRAGDSAGRSAAMALVMDLAESAEVDAVSIGALHPGDEVHVANLLRYFARSRRLGQELPQHQLTLPTPEQVAKGQFDIEVIALVNDDAPREAAIDAIAAAKEKIAALAKSLTPDRIVPAHVDPLHLKHLVPTSNSKQAKAVRALQDAHPVEFHWPKDAEAGTSGADHVLLVWTADSPSQIPSIRSELSKIIQELGEIKVKQLNVPEKHHEDIRGPNDTTLNVIVGEAKNVGVRFGPDDVVEIRGPASELPRAQQEIEAIVARAKAEGVDTSYETTFDMEERFVGYIVGKNGANLSKLQSELGTRITIEHPAAEANGTNGTVVKKAKKPRAHFIIRGRRENVEEAKRRIIAHAERVADEGTASVPLPSGVDRRTIIGKQGTYAQRLETKYEVKINFPKLDDSSDISIRGPRKGVEGAKKELVELIEYERENNHTTTFQVPSSSVPRIVGRQGAAISELQAVTGAQIDVETHADTKTATVTLKGSSEAITSAKKEIQAIAQDSAEEATIEVRVPKALQPGLIGKGGSNIKEMMARAGGPTDTRQQGFMLRLPRQGDETSDLIVLRGRRPIITKLQQQIQAYVDSAQSRVVYGVGVPKSQHAAIIGRGGATVNELQTKHTVKIVFPNWNDASATTPVVNADETADVVAEDLIRILGDLPNCKAAAEEIQAKATPRTLGGDRRKGGPSSTSVERTIDVPSKYHRAVTDSGRFFKRCVPPRVNIDHAGKQLPPQNSRPQPFASKKPTARIDDEPEEDDSGAIDWEVHSLVDTTSVDDIIPWHITAPTEELIDQVEEAINEALGRAERQTHLAYIRVPKSAMPRIIGRQGAGLEFIRHTAGVEVEAIGKRNADTLSFVGTIHGVEAAREEVTKIVNRS